jgi:hypothetical protein
MSQARVVLFPFTPTRDDEMALQPGDMVQILTEYDDGWATGYRLDLQGRPASSGVFPLNCFMVPSMIEGDEEDDYPRT